MTDDTSFLDSRRLQKMSVMTDAHRSRGCLTQCGKTFLQAKHDPMVLTLRANMLMTLFLPHAHFSSFATCMRCGGDVCPLIGATATTTNDTFFLQRTTLPPNTNRTQKKRPIFRSPTCFFFHVVATKKTLTPFHSNSMHPFSRLAPHTERRMRKEFCHHTMSARVQDNCGVQGNASDQQRYLEIHLRSFPGSVYNLTFTRFFSLFHGHSSSILRRYMLSRVSPRLRRHMLSCVKTHVRLDLLQGAPAGFLWCRQARLAVPLVHCCPLHAPGVP